MCDGIFTTSAFVDEKLRCQNVVVINIVLPRTSSDMWYSPERNPGVHSGNFFSALDFYRDKPNLVKEIYTSQALPY